MKNSQTASILGRKSFQLFGRKNGAVFADIEGTDIAAAALAQPALHAVFQRGVDPFRRKSHLFKKRQTEPDDNGRPAYNRAGIFR